MFLWQVVTVFIQKMLEIDGKCEVGAHIPLNVGNPKVWMLEPYKYAIVGLIWIFRWRLI
jgi:hypothetical protein